MLDYIIKLHKQVYISSTLYSIVDSMNLRCCTIQLGSTYSSLDEKVHKFKPNCNFNGFQFNGIWAFVGLFVQKYTLFSWLA